MTWQEMDSAPRDGTQILVARHNDCFFDFAVVWWSRHDKDYPWQADHTAYPIDRFDCWSKIEEPDY